MIYVLANNVVNAGKQCC